MKTEVHITAVKPIVKAEASSEEESDDSESSNNDVPDLFSGKERVLKRLEKRQNNKQTKSKVEKRPVWQDNDDDIYENDRKPSKRRHLTNEQRRERYQQIVGEPAWVKPPIADESASEDDDPLTTKSGLLTTGSKVCSGLLHTKKLRDLNRATYSEHNITSIIFHPTSTVAICTGRNGVANIYAVDGKKNEKLHSLGFEKYPITSAVLVDGRELIVGGLKPFYYTYDLISGKSEQFKLPKEHNVTNLKDMALSPDNKLLATPGRFGEVHIFDTKTKELINTFKQEYVSTALEFTPDSKYLLSHSKTNEVSIFDLAASKPHHKWIDEGCLKGTALSINGKVLAAASAQGVVNIYDMPSVQRERYPTPVKAMMNLTTEITNLQFNSTGELLVFGSAEVPEAIKMVHFPSGTVFMNFPIQFQKLGKPTAMAFSPNSGYMAVGNRESTVSLFRLKDFASY